MWGGGESDKHGVLIIWMVGMSMVVEMMFCGEAALGG